MKCILTAAFCVGTFYVMAPLPAEAGAIERGLDDAPVCLHRMRKGAYITHRQEPQASRDGQ